MQQGRYSKTTKWNVPTNKCVGLSYCRVSTLGQVSEGSGLDSQETTNELLFDKIDTNIEKVFHDTYTGGGDYMQRPAMKALFEHIDNNIMTNFIVVFDDLKRFARDTAEHLLLRKEFDRRKVEVRCTNYDFDDSAEGKFVETIMAASNQYDRESNRRQVVSRQKARALKGYYPFAVAHMYGYKMVKYPEHGKMPTPDKDGHIIKEFLEKFERKEFPRYIDGVKFLKSHNVLRGNAHDEKYIETIKSILLNPLYAGYIHIPKFDIIYAENGQHKAIISKETHKRIVARIHGADVDLKTISKRQINAFDDAMPLRGLILCLGCKKPMTGARTKNIPYYQCNHRDCEFKGRTMNATKVNTDFEALLKTNETSQELVDLTIAIFDDVWRDEAKGYQSAIRSDEGKIATLQKQIDSHIDNASKAGSEAIRKQYEARAEKLLKDLEFINSKPRLDVKDEEMYRTGLAKVLGFIKSPYSLWVSSDVMQKKNLFKFIFEENPIYEKNVGYRTC